MFSFFIVLNSTCTGEPAFTVQCTHRKRCSLSHKSIVGSGGNPVRRAAILDTQTDHT